MKKTLPTATIFTPAKAMPKSIKDAAIILGAIDATPDDIRRAVETLRVDGQVRGGGASLDDVRASAIELVSEAYSRLSSPATPHKEAKRLAGVRFRSGLTESRGGSDGAPAAYSGSPETSIR